MDSEVGSGPKGVGRLGEHRSAAAERSPSVAGSLGGSGVPRVVVVGLGPAGPDLLTQGTMAAIAAAPHRYLRTSRHPSADVVNDATSFDDVYERYATFDQVYRNIVERLVEAATLYGEVLYAVPGSPVVAETTVELLLADARVEVVLVPAMSFVDLAWIRLGVDPHARGARIIDGHQFDHQAAGERGPLLVSQCHSVAVLSDIKLSLDVDAADLPDVTVLQRLGLADESITVVAWNDLDRAVIPDHLTSLWIPELTAPVAGELVQLQDTMRTLRLDCPWDAEQTHQTLARYVIEEAYELVEAIGALDHEAGDVATDPMDPIDHLVEELGDVLFQVVFHACLGEESGAFTLADVARTLQHKLVRRHPHVFGDVEVADAAEVKRNWEQIKSVERGTQGSPGEDPMRGLSPALPALLYASKVVKRAEAAGHEVASHPIAPDEVGDALLALVASARRASVDPEEALRLAAARLRQLVEESFSAPVPLENPHPPTVG